METRRTKLETEALVLGYAMSRLDTEYLHKAGHSTWKAAYEAASNALGEPQASFKNLRDEFDPIHPNSRRGWHRRDLREGRQRIVEQFAAVSDDALMEFVARILSRDEHATEEAIESLMRPANIVAKVAECLLTGRLAEEYFLANHATIVPADGAKLRDDRNTARGYDFAILRSPEWVVEVKGLKERRGGIQFTDREWTEAGFRGPDSWLVVVGNVARQPRATVIRDPRSTIAATCVYTRSVCATWRATVTVE